jgi:hypothetical protein
MHRKSIVDMRVPMRNSEPDPRQYELILCSS